MWLTFLEGNIGSFQKKGRHSRAGGNHACAAKLIVMQYRQRNEEIFGLCLLDSFKDPSTTVEDDLS
jgi:hypothetical protein